MDSHTKARYEKDIRELKKMCDDHFENLLVVLFEKLSRHKQLENGHDKTFCSWSPFQHRS